MLTSICLPSSSSNAHGDKKKSRIKVARRHEAAYDVEKYKTLRSSFGTGRVDSFTIESVGEKSSFLEKCLSPFYIFHIQRGCSSVPFSERRLHARRA
jgi:hypothetical protein